MHQNSQLFYKSQKSIRIIGNGGKTLSRVILIDKTCGQSVLIMQVRIATLKRKLQNSPPLQRLQTCQNESRVRVERSFNSSTNRSFARAKVERTIEQTLGFFICSISASCSSNHRVIRANLVFPHVAVSLERQSSELLGTC